MLGTQFDKWWETNKHRVRLLALTLEDQKTIKALAKDAWDNSTGMAFLRRDLRHRRFRNAQIKKASSMLTREVDGEVNDQTS